MAAAELLAPARLYGAADVSARPCPVPAAAGVYAWYFADALPGVPADETHRALDHTLLYVGISPKAPPTNGRPLSRQTLRSRIRSHYRGNAEVSTLRLTLGVLLADRLDISLRRVGSGKRFTFGKVGEARLTEWMAGNARVVWMATPDGWVIEEELISTFDLPLNLDRNRHGAFHQELSALRAKQKARARDLPIEP